VQFDNALNLLWLLFALSAITGTLRSRVNRSKRISTRGPVWLHLCGVALILATLFPYISATDDVLRIEHMNRKHFPGHQHEGKRTASDSLIRLYEAMDTPLVASIKQISLSLIFLSLVIAPVLTGVDRKPPLFTGRSPPACT
jgi:hypothetical protein